MTINLAHLFLECTVRKAKCKWTTSVRSVKLLCTMSVGNIHDRNTGIGSIRYWEGELTPDNRVYHSACGDVDHSLVLLYIRVSHTGKCFTSGRPSASCHSFNEEQVLLSATGSQTVWTVLTITKPFLRRSCQSRMRCCVLLQPLGWCCVDCVIHHERDVREE